MESPNGEPIAGALLEAQDDVSPIDRVAQTNEYGNFFIQGLPTDHNLGWRCYVRLRAIPNNIWADIRRRSGYSYGCWKKLEPIQLTEGIYLSGVVEGPQGPIEDAEVFGYSDHKLWVETPKKMERFFYKVFLGDALVWSSAQGHATTYAPNFDRPTEFFHSLKKAIKKMILPFSCQKKTSLPSTLLMTAPYLAQVFYSTMTTALSGEEIPLMIKEQQPSIVYTMEHTFSKYAENDGYFNEWYEDEQGQVPIVIDGNTDLTIELEPASNLTGTIIDDSGHPVYGADILMNNGIDINVLEAPRMEHIPWGLYEDTWEFSVSYTPLCQSDRSYVTMYYPNNATYLEDMIIDQSTHEHNVTLPIDDDHDQMADAWEEENGLDPARNDALEDPDLDGLSNLEEYQNQSDPTEEKESQWLPKHKCFISATDFLFGLAETRMKTKLQILIGLSLGILSMWWATKNTDWTQVWLYLKDVQSTDMLIVAVLFMIQQLLRAHRQILLLPKISL